MNSPTPSGEVTIDGPITKEQAGAQEAFREHALKHCRAISKLKRR